MTKQEFLSGRSFLYQGNPAAGGPYHYSNNGIPYIALDNHDQYCSISAVRDTHVKCVVTVFGRAVRYNLRYEDLTPVVPVLSLAKIGKL